MKRGSNNRENMVNEVPPVSPVCGQTDTGALLSFREMLGSAPSSVRAVFDDLLYTPARARLLRALIAVLRMMLQESRSTGDAGGDGLTAEERGALTALHLNGAGANHIGTAHVLLCTAERALLMAQWRDAARKADTQKHSHLTTTKNGE
jgi:hypothetical protein